MRCEQWWPELRRRELWRWPLRCGQWRPELRRLRLWRELVRLRRARRRRERLRCGQCRRELRLWGRGRRWGEPRLPLRLWRLWLWRGRRGAPNARVRPRGCAEARRRHRVARRDDLRDAGELLARRARRGGFGRLAGRLPRERCRVESGQELRWNGGTRRWCFTGAGWPSGLRRCACACGAARRSRFRRSARALRLGESRRRRWRARRRGLSLRGYGLCRPGPVAGGRRDGQAPIEVGNAPQERPRGWRRLVGRRRRRGRAHGAFRGARSSRGTARRGRRSGLGRCWCRGCGRRRWCRARCGCRPSSWCTSRRCCCRWSR